MQQPTITIITISYNNKTGLEKTLASVTSQSHQDFEYIVIDGGSQDGSKEVLEQYSDKISYWVSEPDKGIYNAMNKGIQAATGEYLLFLNSGDHFKEKSTLEKAIPQLTGEDIIYGDLEFVDQQLSHIANYSNELSFYFFYSGALPHPASFIRKSAFKETELYDENLKIVSDWKWFLKAFVTYNLSFKHISQIISSFYLDGISSTNTEQTNHERQKVLQELPKDFLALCKIIDDKEKEIKHFKIFEYKYQFLTKYRIIKLLNRLGAITIK